jgi:hypothetical protein
VGLVEVIDIADIADILKIYYRHAREALLHASTSPRVETSSGILFLLMAKCRGDGREPSQRVQRCRSTLW